MRVETQSIHFDADVKLVDFVNQKVGKLETYYNRILSAEVTLKLENSGQVRDKVSEIVLRVPGDTLVAKETDKSFEASVDAAVEALRRQLIKYKERMRA